MFGLDGFDLPLDPEAIDLPFLGTPLADAVTVYYPSFPGEPMEPVINAALIEDLLTTAEIDYSYLNLLQSGEHYAASLN